MTGMSLYKSQIARKTNQKPEITTTITRHQILLSSHQQIITYICERKHKTVFLFLRGRDW